MRKRLSRRRLVADLYSVVENLEARRLLAVFAPDTSFGDAGTIPLGGSISPQADGSYLVSHSKTFSDDTGDLDHVEYYQTKLKANGSVDTSYGDKGTKDFGQEPYFNVGGRSYIFELGRGFNEYIVARSAGDLKTDKSFGGNGLVNIPGINRYNAADFSVTGRDIEAGPDGDIYVTFEGYYSFSRDRFRFANEVVRLNKDGSVDKSWGNNGYLGLGNQNGSFFVGGAGSNFALVSGPGDWELRKYLADGKNIDRSFGGGDGVIHFQNIQRITERRDGKIYYIQNDIGSDNVERPRLYRLKNDGSPDTSFGQNGSVSVYVDSPKSFRDEHMFFDAQGRIWVNASETLFRFNSDGVLDAAPYNGTLDLPGQLLALDRDGGAFFGAGYDSIVRFDEKAPAEVGADGVLYIDGNASNDTVSVTLENDGRLHTRVNGTPMNVRAKGIKRIVMRLQGGNNTVTASTDIPIFISSGSGNDTFNLGAENDDIESGTGNATINLGQGNNGLLVGPKIGKRDENLEELATITAGDGDNSINVHTGLSKITLGSGDNNVRVDPTANDTDIRIAGGSNTIDVWGKEATVNIGGDENQNVKVSRLDHANVTTGGGDDTFEVYDSATIHSGGGNDTFTILGSVSAPEPVDIIAGDGNDHVEAKSSYEGMIGTFQLGAGDDYFLGSGQSQTVSGDAGNDTLIGGDGNESHPTQPDLLDGGEGNDRIFGSEADDRLIGGRGNDYIKAGAGNDRVSAGAGRDKVWGEAGNDDINGGVHDDTISGGLGNDSLNGGADRDILLGDEGNDALTDNDGSIDQLIGGAGTDSGRGDRDLDAFDPTTEIIV